jgi:hypothetical protein
VQKGKELNDFQRNPLEIEILSNLMFGSLEIRDTSVMRVTNKNLDNEHQRLEKLYHDRHIDTCTRREKDHDKDREKTVDDTSRNNSRQRDATRPTRQGVVTKNNRNRQQVDDHESTDDAAEMTTNLDD